MNGGQALAHLHVTCAIIEQEGKVLAAQRGAEMSLPLKWEFPGGKIDPGETAEECLRRELVEELGVEIAVGRPLAATTYAYPDFIVTLYPFVCTINSGTLVLHEHRAVVWLPPDQLDSLDWAEADGPILADYLGRFPSGNSG